MKTILLAFLMVGTAFGACTVKSTRSDGTKVYHCPGTGTDVENGSAVFTLFNASTPPCGSTIIVDAGATYSNHEDTSFRYAVRLKSLTGCTGKRYTEIVSSRINELPEGKIVTAADMPKLAKFTVSSTKGTGGSAALFEFWGGAQYYALRGLALTVGTNINTTPGTLIASTTIFGATTAFDGLPKHIRIDRCWMGPEEELVYGPMENSTVAANYFRGPVIAYSMNGEDILVTASTVKGLGGYNETTSPVTATVTAATNANPPVLTATGIASAFSIASGVSACSTGCNGTCWTSLGCRVGVIEGLTGDWANLNGWSYLVYESADSVRVYRKFDNSLGQPDSTTWGALPGSFTVRRGIPNDPSYAFAVSACVDCRIINNFIEAWSMTIFTGGNNFEAGAHTCTTDSTGNDSTHVNCTTAPDFIKPGDLIRYFGTSAQQAQVVSVSGTTIEFAPWGESGTQTPTAGGVVRWNGRQTTNFQLRRNWIQRLNAQTLAGKGYIELKNCVNCLLDGNIMTDNSDGNWFLTTRNQAGNDPWVRAENLTFSNNLGPGNNRHTLQGQDDLATNALSYNVVSRNNLIPQVEFPSTATYYHTYGCGGILGCTISHNTFITDHGGPNHRWHIPQDCIAAEDYLMQHAGGVSIRDNIYSYGIGTTNGSACGWSDQFTGAIHHNVFDDDLNQTTATIESTLPGNTGIADISTEMVGACTWANIDNCALDPSSTLRGTASDGKDPGVDIEEMHDHQLGWSEDAGLLRFTALGAHSTIQPSSTKAVARFRLHNPLGNCTVELFTAPNRTSAHADASTAQACNRAGSLVENGSIVTYVFGASSALTANTPYYYRISDGSRVMVGEFRTRPGGGGSGTIRLTFSASRSGQYSSNADMSSPTGVSGTEWSIPVAEGGIVYVRQAGGPVVAYRGR